MPTSVLFATDGGDNAESAWKYALDEFHPSPDRLHALFVTEPAVYVTRIAGPAVITEQTEQHPIADAFLAHVGRTATDRGVEVVTDRVAGRFETAVASYLDETKIDHLIVDRDPSSSLFSRLLPGSRSRLARRISVPVTFVGHPTTTGRDEARRPHATTIE